MADELPKDKPVGEKVVVDDVEAPEVDEAPLLEPETPPEPDSKVHPLEPRGKRFEQVYAKGKQAERDAQSLREQLAAANAKLEVLQGSTQPQNEADREYTWSELETFIQQGRITRADAEAHRESVMERKLTRKVKGDFTQEAQQATRDQALTKTLQDYVTAVPAITQEGSADRLRLDEEFDWLASVQGLDPSKVDGMQRKALQAAALRNVYGPIDSLRRRSAPARVESSQGLPGGDPPTTKVNNDQALLNKLSKPQVAHYKKMMAAGRYKGGWKDVVAELKYEAPKRGSR